MTDVLDPAPIIEAAQEAAAAGDYSEAERLLREAAALQEASLGLLHPDLAIILNNLAFVCERTNKVDDAERGYRRAHAIAVASLPPGHPFIATSLGNLLEFCEAHEIPIWKPPAARADDETSGESESEARSEPVPRVYGPGRPSPVRTIALATFGVAVVAAVLFALQRREPTETSAALPPAQHVSSVRDSPAAAATAPVLTRAPEPAVTLERPPDATTAPVERAKPRETSAASPTVSVLNAQLCSALEKSGSPDWHCVSVNGDLQPGTYVFYTRLLTNADTTVEHRWHHGDRVHQVRRLRVSPSPGRGYRTFSSTTISPERSGVWRVELRAADGTLLREARFVVR